MVRAGGREGRGCLHVRPTELVDAVAREHRATRASVALFDQTSFAKFLFTGPDAEAVLSWICANDVAKPVGSLIYTQMLNRRGGIECDLTIARLAEDTYYIVTGTGFATHEQSGSYSSATFQAVSTPV